MARREIDQSRTAPRNSGRWGEDTGVDRLEKEVSHSVRERIRDIKGKVRSYLHPSRQWRAERKNFLSTHEDGA